MEEREYRRSRKVTVVDMILQRIMMAESEEEQMLTLNPRTNGRYLRETGRKKKMRSIFLT